VGAVLIKVAYASLAGWSGCSFTRCSSIVGRPPVQAVLHVYISTGNLLIGMGGGNCFILAYRGILWHAGIHSYKHVFGNFHCVLAYRLFSGAGRGWRSLQLWQRFLCGIVAMFSWDDGQRLRRLFCNMGTCYFVGVGLGRQLLFYFERPS